MFLSFRKGKGAQIATLIVLFVALVILLTAVIINISRVSQKRVSVRNAATGAALQIASSLGSWAHMLSCKYIDCGERKCRFRWRIIIYIFVAILVVIVAVVIAVLIILLTLGAGTPVAIGLVAGAVVGAAVLVTMAVLQYAHYDPQMLGAMNRAFRKMTVSQQVREGAIRYAFQNTIDDRQKVADMHDIDMDNKWGLDANGQPQDTIGRFAYHYTRRLMYLINAGPGPDGSYRNYRQKLLDLIAVFLPQLETFTSRCQGFAAYLGPAPTQKEPLTNVPATPQGINSLYTLFAYLREREYRNTDNEIYNLSYPENIWTQGFLACVHGEDEDPTDPCYHDSRNDQVDALAYSLEDFSHPVDPGVPIEDDDAGFAPTLIAATPQERYQAFDLWYPNLYANNAAYEDYYSQIYDILDDSATENLAEKGWHKALGDWSLRMNVMAEDIRRRRDDAGRNSAEGRRLTALLNQIEEAQNRISLFRQDILNFRQAIEDLAAGYQDIDNFGGVAAGSLYSSNPTYVWNDSLGRHSVQVTVSDFVLATLKAYRRGCCTHCIKLINHSGSVTVTVIREDSPTEARLPGRALLWRFTYPRISCTASANYSYNSNPSLGGVTEH